ncbi:MAG: AAA family ATPase [Bacteroidales bacterium]
MEQLNTIYRDLIKNTDLSFQRYLLDQINWNSRLIAIIGARGTGKTTLMLQQIKLTGKINKSLYASVDNFYFSNHNIFDFAGKLYKYGIRYLYLDEVHKYKGWSREIKNIYDSFPDMKIVFSGSSVLDIYKGFGDLSRRVVPYVLNGLSFREYLIFETGKVFDKSNLKQVLSHQVNYDIETPLVYFKDYLKHGYYPFYKEDDYYVKLSGVINAVLETDIPKYLDIKLSTVEKLKQLLQIISENVPFKPNYVKIADTIGVSRNLLPNYFYYLEKAGLIMLLKDPTKGVTSLGKINKVYLNNSNLAHVLASENVNTGTIRETFFMNQLQTNHKIYSQKHGDFFVDDMVFEIGGKNKTRKQIKNLENAWVVKDDIEYGIGNTIPLWHFGMMY